MRCLRGCNPLNHVEAVVCEHAISSRDEEEFSLDFANNQGTPGQAWNRAFW